MTSPVSSSEHVAPRAALSAAQYAASRHAVWLGAAAIVTDQVGRVLLVHPTYREDDRRLLPGGVVEPGEHPQVTCRREITEELGLPDLPLAGVLAVHSLSPHHPDIRPGMPCPGEIRYVFDGGTLTPEHVKAIRLPREELSEFAFLETRDAVQRLLPVDGQIMRRGLRRSGAQRPAPPGRTCHRHRAGGRRPGHPFARLLATPSQAAALLGWGPPGARQARLAAETARDRWGLPTARPTEVEEVPTEGMRLS